MLLTINIFWNKRAQQFKNQNMNTMKKSPHIALKLWIQKPYKTQNYNLQISVKKMGSFKTCYNLS
jgi:hypothetical protein